MTVNNVKSGQHLYYFVVCTAGDNWTYKVTEYEYVKPEHADREWGIHIMKKVDTGRTVRRDLDLRYIGEYAHELSPLDEKKWGVWSLSAEPKEAFDTVRKMYEFRISAAEEQISIWKDILARCE